jgi:hypothetical protein
MYASVMNQQMRSYQGMRVGAERRIRAMFYRGFNTTTISRLTGLDSKTIQLIAEGDWDVSEREFEAVRVGFNSTLCMENPQGSTAKQATENAIRNGWSPFGVWSNIDDPDCKPETLMDPGTEEAMNKIRKLVSLGWTIKTIAVTASINVTSAYDIAYGRSSKKLRQVTIDKIDQCYQKLKNELPPDDHHARRSRKLAKDNGWTKS